MVHGYGKNGGRGRCFIFWQDLLTCVQHANAANIDHMKECEPQREDYIECLHHKKLYDRISVIKREKERLIKEGLMDPSKQSTKI
jgi:NADH dehydrogenase (ubiquinone) Fe-S protein 5